MHGPALIALQLLSRDVYHVVVKAFTCNARACMLMHVGVLVQLVGLVSQQGI